MEKAEYTAREMGRMTKPPEETPTTLKMGLDSIKKKRRCWKGHSSLLKVKRK
jgi:hypothetical protein